MPVYLTDDYSQFAATQDRVADTKQQTRAAVKAYQRKREQGSGDPIEMAIAERGVVWEPPPEAPLPLDSAPLGTLHHEHYARVSRARDRWREQGWLYVVGWNKPACGNGERLMAAESVEAR